MILEHIAIYVTDLETMRNFYQTYFNAKSNDGYANPKTGLRTYFLQFENDARIELMTRPDMSAHDKTAMHPLGYVHIAFKLGSTAAVDTLTERLRVDGYTVSGEPRTTGDGYYESIVLDPEGNTIELVK